MPDNTACRQIDRVCVVYGIAGFSVLGHLKVRLTIGMKRAPAFKQSRGSGMIFGRTRPKDSHLLVDFFIGNSVIIGDPSTRGFSEFVKDFARRSKTEKMSPAQFPREITEDLRVWESIAGRRYGLPDMNDAAFDVAGDAFFFLLQAACEDNVGIMRCFGHEEVDNT